MAAPLVNDRKNVPPMTSELPPYTVLKLLVRIDDGFGSHPSWSYVVRSPLCQPQEPFSRCCCAQVLGMPPSKLLATSSVSGSRAMMSAPVKPLDDPPPSSALSIVTRSRTFNPFRLVSVVNPQIVRSPNFKPEFATRAPASAKSTSSWR